jgi:putative ABC transport system ATP-binding protein
MNKNEIIRIENLRREFLVGNEIVKALRGVSFSIKAGEFVSIMGASGSGKSTLLNVLGCLDKPTGGDYYLDGNNVKDMSKDELAEYRNRKIGFVFQSYNLLPRTTALTNVELPLLYNKEIKNSERVKRAKEALDAVGLAERFDHTPAQMSGGQQQRVAIARALVNDPVIILADEATGNLDTKTSYEIMSLFQELNMQGKTIAFVTHEPDIASFCSRNIYLRDGVLLKDKINNKIASAGGMLESLPAIDEHEVIYE